jgi:hypothetical protein
MSYYYSDSPNPPQGFGVGSSSHYNTPGSWMYLFATYYMTEATAPTGGVPYAQYATFYQNNYLWGLGAGSAGDTSGIFYGTDYENVLIGASSLRKWAGKPTASAVGVVSW